jgi:hypoxanthine phosphoribosyltransferase
MSDKLKEIYSAEVIAQRISVLGREISAEYAGDSLVVVCVLKGAFMFFPDLVRAVDLDLSLEFVRLASYGKKTTRSGDLVFSKDLESPISGRHVLIVEDIVDTGHSVHFLTQTLAAREPASLKIAALVDKHERREVDVKVDFPGFVLSQGFLVGYGMDYAEKYRDLDGIYELMTEK